MCLSSSWRYSYNKYSTLRQLKNGDEESEKGISQNEYTRSNILRRYKDRPSNLDHMNLYKFVAFHFYQDQVIYPQFFGYNKVGNFLPTENYSKIMLTIYKPWNNSIEEILDNPEDTFSSHLMCYMYDEDFSQTDINGFDSCQNCNEVCKYRRNNLFDS